MNYYFKTNLRTNPKSNTPKPTIVEINPNEPLLSPLVLGNFLGSGLTTFLYSIKT